MNEILKPGKYYLGDPADVLTSKVYIGIWGDQHYFNNGKFDALGVEFVVHNTHNGDNIFKDTKNRSYSVSTGVIGLVHIDLIDDMIFCKNGHIFSFKDKVNFIYDAGIFYVKSGKKYIQIDTRDLENYDSEIEEHCENEDGEYISNTICNASDDDSISDDNINYFEDDDEQLFSIEKTKDERVQFFKKKN